MLWPMAPPTSSATITIAGCTSTEFCMSFGPMNVYTNCCTHTVSTSASTAVMGLTNRPTTAATAPPIQGPTTGIRFRTPVIRPNAAAFGTPNTANPMPHAVPIMKHCSTVARI